MFIIIILKLQNERSIFFIVSNAISKNIYFTSSILTELY